jgi:uridine kinase
MRPYLIGIAGPSCSGKSEVSRRLARILRAPTLVLDHYYKDLKHVSFEERAKTNFDAPESLDAELIAEHVRRLRQGQPIDQPEYDFARHVRAESSHRIEPADYVLVEGLFALYWPQVREQLDFRIYITTDHATCLARRIFRDVRERGRTEASVREQYERTVQPMAELHLAPTAAYADLVLAGVAPVKQSVYSVLLHIAERLEDPRREDAVRQVIDVWQVATEENPHPAI